MDSQHMGSGDLASPGSQGFKGWTSKPSKEDPSGRGETQSTCDVMQCCNMREGETCICIGACHEMPPDVMAKAVGTTGQIICVIPKKCTTGAAQAMMKCNIPNVRCVESNMQTIDARDNTADVVCSRVLSQHVAPRDVPNMMEEMCRVLSPGGRLAMTDVIMRKDMPDSVKNMMPSWYQPLKNSMQMSMYESHLKNAGFEHICIKDTRKDVTACLMDKHHEGHPHHEAGGVHDPQHQRGSSRDEDKTGSYRRKVGKFTRQLVAGQEEREEDIDWNEYAGMYQITARKPM